MTIATELNLESKEYFKHKNITLINRNSLNPNLFTTEFIDLIVTSPPYNVGIELMMINYLMIDT